MEIRKNWFYYFATAFAVILLLFAFFSGVNQIGEGFRYPYLARGLLFLGMFLLWMLLWYAAHFAARFCWQEKLSAEKKQMKAIEAVLVLSILILAAAVRVMAVKQFPVLPDSQYRNAYEIARLLFHDMLLDRGADYCDYISLFPGTMGYSYLLKIAFGIFGEGVTAGQYANVCFQIGTAFLVYQSARKLGGRSAAITALLLCAFWPSQIAGVVLISPEAAYAFFFFLCIRIFVSLVMDYGGETLSGGWAAALHVILGIFLAVASVLRPSAWVLLAAMLVTLLTNHITLPALPQNEIPLAVRFLGKGWLRCIVVIFTFFLFRGILFSNIELAADRTLPKAMDSAGFSLLAGANQEAAGGWNQEDEALLYNNLEETGSASKAQKECLVLAQDRMFRSTKETWELYTKKFTLLWGSDGEEITEMQSLLEKQQDLTRERESLLSTLYGLNQPFYLIVLFFVLAAFIFCLFTRGGPQFVLVFSFVGTALMYLPFESRTSYHFFSMQIFAMLTGMAVHHLFALEREKQTVRSRKLEILEEEERLKELKLSMMEDEVEKMAKMRREALENVFDMQSALKEGHIVMTVSKACGEEETPRKKAAKDIPKEVKRAIAPETVEKRPQQSAGMESEHQTMDSLQNREAQKKQMQDRKQGMKNTSPSVELKDWASDVIEVESDWASGIERDPDWDKIVKKRA